MVAQTLHTISVRIIEHTNTIRVQAVFTNHKFSTWIRL